MKKFIKIIIIILSIIIALLAALILLLSIFFPSELVRKEIEKQGSAFIGTEVKLEKLSFNIFTGLELEGFSVAQYGKGWESGQIISLQSARLKYRLIPLIFRTVSIKECVVEKGVVNLERNRKTANWDYFLKKFTVKPDDKGEVSVKSKEADTAKKEEGFKNTSLPLEVDINRVGIDGLSLNYTDTTLFDIPAKLSVKNLRLLGNNIRVQKNTPCDVDGYIIFGFDGGKHINLFAEAKTDGKLKLFDDTTHEVSVTGPLTFRLYKASFMSKDIKGMLQKIIEDVTEKNFGPFINLALNDPGMIMDEADKYFNTLLDSSDETIKKTVKNAEAILSKKGELNDYGKQTVNDHNKSIDSQISDIDEKINTVDSRLSTAIDTLSRVPGIGSRVDFNYYKKRASEIKNNSLAKKNEIVKTSKKGISGEVAKTLAANLPKQIPDYNSLKKKFSTSVDGYKKNIRNELKKYSIKNFIGSLMPALGFLDQELTVSDLSTTIMLNKKSKDASDIKIVTDYFSMNGNAIFDDRKFLDYSGNVSINTDKFKLEYFPVKEVSAKVKVTGVIPNLKVSIIEFPEFTIDKDKQKELVSLILNNFLNNNYGSSEIIKSIMKGVSLEDINVDKIKKLLDGDRMDSLNSFISKKDTLKNSVDSEITNLINEMNRKAQENITSPVNIPKLF